MELSKQKQTEAKKLNVTVQYLVMADLMAVGYSENDAYTIAFPENAALSVQQNNSIRSNILDSAKFKKLFESRRSRVKDGVAAPVQLEEVELVSTEEVMKEILRSGCELLSKRIFDILETTCSSHINTTYCCELLSKRIFDILETTGATGTTQQHLL